MKFKTLKYFCNKYFCNCFKNKRNKSANIKLMNITEDLLDNTEKLSDNDTGNLSDNLSDNDTGNLSDNDRDEFYNCYESYEEMIIKIN